MVSGSLTSLWEAFNLPPITMEWILCTQFFRSVGAPFSISPNPKHLYERSVTGGPRPPQLRVAGRWWFRAADREVGTGKTTVSRCLLQQLPARHRDRLHPQSLSDQSGICWPPSGRIPVALRRRRPASSNCPTLSGIICWQNLAAKASATWCQWTKAQHPLPGVLSRCDCSPI